MNAMRNKQTIPETISQALANWHQQLLILSHYDNSDQLIKAAVFSCQQALGIERVGILLLDDQQWVKGAWGVDEQGQVVDISDFHRPLTEMSWAREPLAKQSFVACKNDTELMHNERVVGRGWNAMAGLWSGEQCFGWLAVDDLLQPGQVPSWTDDLLGIIAQGLGMLLGRLKQHKELQSLNQLLEAQVQQRSVELESQVDTLKRLEQEFLKSERLASVGNLVAGVAHEISTPLGNSLTALSMMNERLQQLLQSLGKKQLTHSELSTGLQHLQQNQLLVEQALLRAKKIVQDFRQMADYQTHTTADIIWLKTLVDNILASHHNQLKRRPIRIDNQINENLHFFDDPSDLTFILTSLLNNSLTHGFEPEEEGEIIIQAELQQDWLLLSFIDNGKGVAEELLERIFEPFFQLQTLRGHSGMGLHTVNKLIQDRKGYINAYANHPKGLIIVIRLPLGDEHEQ